jgi:hypothetical protein
LALDGSFLAVQWIPFAAARCWGICCLGIPRVSTSHHKMYQVC